MSIYLHVRRTDGTVEHHDITYGKAVINDYCLECWELRRVGPNEMKVAWPLVNVMRYWFNEREYG